MSSVSLSSKWSSVSTSRAFTAHLQGTSTTVCAQLISALYGVEICDGISTPPFVLAAPLQLRAETFVTDVVVGRTHWGNRDDHPGGAA